ncbi:MAG: short-chain dehydrogenase/reductase [Mycobacterium sp.]|nr:short-chain dehydrogenase/reductase [Mycobacterium sp.]
MNSVLVTGAGHGIGRATAELFLARGWRVGAYDVDTAALDGLPGAVTGELDVRDHGAWNTRLAEFCGDGGLDVLVNNAGVLVSGPFTAHPAEAYRRLVDVNVTGVLNGCLAARPYLRRGSTVVNLCSASALYGQPGLATYGATKAAVKSLTEALDLEWGNDGIRVRDLLPLFVATDMVTGMDARSVENLGVRLAPGDIADAVWRAVHDRGRLPRSPHRTVGGQSRLFAVASAVSPAWLNRLAVRRTAR